MVLFLLLWRENFNAHGFDIITFYVRVESVVPSDHWQLVPFFDERGVPEKSSYTTEMGADCIPIVMLG